MDRMTPMVNTLSSSSTLFRRFFISDRIYEGENLSPRANQAECAKERHTRQVFSDSDTTTNRGGGTLKQMYRNFNEDFPGGLPGTLSTLSRNRSLSLDLQTPVNSTVYEVSLVTC